MTPEELQKSVVLITSTDPQISRFGTGFVVSSRSGTVHLLTCAHVVRDVGGSEKVEVEGKKAIALVTGEEEGLDLAVLRVEGLGSKKELKLGKAGEEKSKFLTAGFQQITSKTRLLKSLRGKLKNRVELSTKKSEERVKGWELSLESEDNLKSGYSGAPIVAEESERVIGVISLKQDEGKKGFGIESAELGKIWKYIDSEELYQKLAKLGYRQQVRLFRRLVSKQNLAALLIYGPPDYGQRWLLNVLLTNHLPGIETSKVVNVSLKRRGRSPSTQVLGRDFHRFLGFGNPVTLAEAAKAVYQCWQTRNVILIFHDVDWIGAENAKKLIEEFWQPLTQEVRKAGGKEREVSSKLFMFLIDYQGKTGNLNSIFRERARENNQKESPLKAPEIEEFTEDEIWDWIDEEREALPAQLVGEIDEQVERILEKSEGGIPELTLEEICASCGYNWIEEAGKWLRY